MGDKIKDQRSAMTYIRKLVVMTGITRGAHAKGRSDQGRKLSAWRSTGLLAVVLALTLPLIFFSVPAYAATTTPLLYAAPSGTARTGASCTSRPSSTSGSSSVCSLKDALTAASNSDRSVTIDLVHLDGSACSSTNVCTFKGGFTIPNITSGLTLTI